MDKGCATGSEHTFNTRHEGDSVAVTAGYVDKSGENTRLLNYVLCSRDARISAEIKARDPSRIGDSVSISQRGDRLRGACRRPDDIFQ